MERPELLIPAGNLEKLRTAILYGADAVYVGVSGLSLRAEQAEFSLAGLRLGVAEAHRQKVKVYAALNIFARNQDLEVIAEIVPELMAIGVDAVIVSDPGVLSLVRRVTPELPIHLSTQANTTNLAAVRFWAEQGVKRIVLARELNLEETALIAREAPEVELELFIHGAMCMAYSGRCFLSAWRNQRSSNQGDCTQPCRWEHLLIESTRPDQPICIEEDDRFTYFLSSKDLCLIEYLPLIMAAGIKSLKIEGRMKSVYYLATVTRIYRQAIDAYLKDPAGWVCDPEWPAELGKVANRGYTTGFYFSKERISAINPEEKYLQTHDLVGTVLEYDATKGLILVGVRNQVSRNDQVELLLPDRNLALDSTQMTGLEGCGIQEAHNGYQVFFPVVMPVPKGAVLRRSLTSG